MKHHEGLRINNIADVGHSALGRDDRPEKCNMYICVYVHILMCIYIYIHNIRMYIYIYIYHIHLLDYISIYVYHICEYQYVCFGGEPPRKRSGLDLSVLLQANAIVFVWEKNLMGLRQHQRINAPKIGHRNHRTGLPIRSIRWLGNSIRSSNRLPSVYRE